SCSSLHKVPCCSPFERDFEAVLLSPQVLDLLGGGDCSDGDAIDAYLKRRVLTYLDDRTEDDKADGEIALLSNWTGPPVTIHVPDLLAQALLSSFTEPGALTSALLGSLLLDGESVYRLVWNSFLLLASIKLVNCAIKLDSLQVRHNHPPPKRKYVYTIPVKKLSIQFHHECGFTSLTYYENNPAKEHFQWVSNTPELDVELTLSPTPLACLPKVSPFHLHPHSHGGITWAKKYFKNNPIHKLTEEELLAFTSCILSQPKFWAVVTALCLRTNLERGSSRRVEGAMQTQMKVDCFEEKSCPVTQRLKRFYCCQAPPRWAVQVTPPH
uniref:Uncharacterized protein n=1 Tax=Oncorhynchus tshawytscha TaxID=74940 RepID=A0AAZ3RUD7_ONCTS